MIVFILACVLVYSVSRYHDLSPLYLSEGHGLLCYLAYPLVHASFAHLAMNSIAMLSFWNRLDRDAIRAFVASLLVSFPIATLAGVSATPTVGSSGIAFTLIGTYLSVLLRDHGYRAFLKFLCLVSVIMATQAVLACGSVNWIIHATSLYVSTTISCLYMEWKKRKS